MSATVLAAAADITLDAANLGQSTNSSRSEPRFGLLASAFVWGGWMGAHALQNSDNVKMLGGQPGFWNRTIRGQSFERGSLLQRMGSANSRAGRQAIAGQYFKSGEYAKQFGKYTSGLEEGAEKLTQIKKVAAFTDVAERAYVRGAAGGFLRKVAGGANMALFVAPWLVGMTHHGFRGIKRLGYEMDTPKMGGHFQLNAMQATERQRALAAMHNSEFNGRSMLGNEAGILHQ